MLVLLFVALCICLVHLGQTNQGKDRQFSAAKPSGKTSVSQITWLSGDVPEGFYSFSGSGLSYKDLFTSFNLQFSGNQILLKEIFLPERSTSYSIQKGRVVKSTSVPSSTTPFFYLPLSINLADKELLTTLPGIGERLAQNIIDYREGVGEFSSIDQLMKVEGVGEMKFHKIKDSVSL